MNWCQLHQTEFTYCQGKHIAVSKAKDQMSFGDFETILSIIEKATEKDLEDITQMVENRLATLKLISNKKDRELNSSES